MEAYESMSTDIAMKAMEQESIEPREHAINVVVSSDYYHAYLTVDPGVNVPDLTLDDLLAALALKNVTFGVDLEALNAIVADPLHAKSILVALGIPLQNGIDGELTLMHIPAEKRRPKLLEDGSVDHKDVTAFDFVKQGDVLAVRTLSTKGEDGMSVTGRTIKAKDGKEIYFKQGKNTVLSEDKLQLLAEKDGVVEFVGDQIDVVEILVIHEDVGVKTGNIHFTGKVIVHGNLTSGYEIISDDSVEINGIVESALIKSKGDVFIKQGVQGKDIASIECGGNLVSGFLNNCHVHVAGSIEVDSVLHCHIQCDETVHVKGKRGQVIGGVINVRKELVAGVIGSEIGTLTSIRLGVDSNVVKTYKEIVQDLTEQQATLKKLSQAITLLTKQVVATGSDELIRVLEKTKASQMEYEKKCHVLQQRFKEINELINNLRDASVKADTIHPGVKVRIGHSNYRVMQALLGVRLLMVDDKIIPVSYEKIKA